MELKEQFIEIYNKNITRQGSQELLTWLLKTDFFTTPASTKYHGACESGLVMHSINVYNTLINRYYDEANDNIESFTIASLLHDLCKTNFYKTATRNHKNETTGAWEKVQYYTIEDSFPYGHGEKSVFLIERFIKLKVEEAVAIRWHMGGFDESVKGGSYSISLAYDKYPLAVKLHLSDLESSYLVEKNTSAVRRNS